uniref:Uncharacterized protein n=1 Tax=Timema monikensis TaxID=170555 RepID=A0A7R9HSZ7_9NEOP|nr:unnamed protein product [Timema monikensis]
MDKNPGTLGSMVALQYSIPNRDSSFGLPVISSPAYCESDTEASERLVCDLVVAQASERLVCDLVVAQASERLVSDLVVAQASERNLQLCHVLMMLTGNG